MTTVSVHQPGYLPWLGLIDKIARSDVFVILDTVQFNRRAFQHRTQYSTESGAQYLGLNVHAKGHQESGQTIAETRLADPHLPAKHFETLRHRYGRRPGWPALEPRLGAILHRPWPELAPLAIATLEFTLDVFGVRTRLLHAAALHATGAKGDLMLALTRSAGGTRYLSGRGAQTYMDDAKFAAAGIDVDYQNFVHPTYRQSHAGAFVPGCFALEWPIEEPESARDRFLAHIGGGSPQSDETGSAAADVRL